MAHQWAEININMMPSENSTSDKNKIWATEEAVELKKPDMAF